MSNHEDGRARSKYRDWILPALGAGLAGVAYGLMVVFLMAPVVDAAAGGLATAGVFLGPILPRANARFSAGRLATLMHARAVRSRWKALVLLLAVPSFLACTDPVGVASVEGALMTKPTLSDTIYPCRIGGGDRREVNDRLTVEGTGRC